MKKIFIFILIVFFTTLAFAQVPTFHQFYGEIKDNNGNLIKNACMDAYINNNPVGSYKSPNGSYGLAELFFVSDGKNGDEIKFYVSGLYSKSFIFENEGLTELNLILTAYEDKLCGNGNIDCNEECEGTNFNGDSCAKRGFSQGSLSCSSCKIDASACSNPAGGGNGGGGGGGGGASCVSNWSCNWSECINGVQRYNCTDLRNCNNNTGKPAEQTRNCSVSTDTDDLLTGNGLDSYNKGEQPDVNWIYLMLIFILLTLAIISGIAIVIARNKNAKKQKKDMDLKIKEFIVKARMRGYSNKEIKEMLIKNGWKEEEIDDILEK